MRHPAYRPRDRRGPYRPCARPGGDGRVHRRTRRRARAAAASTLDVREEERHHSSRELAWHATIISCRSTSVEVRLLRGKPAWTTALASLCAGERDALKILRGVLRRAKELAFFGERGVDLPCGLGRDRCDGRHSSRFGISRRARGRSGKLMRLALVHWFSRLSPSASSSPASSTVPSATRRANSVRERTPIFR